MSRNTVYRVGLCSLNAVTGLRVREKLWLHQVSTLFWPSFYCFYNGFFSCLSAHSFVVVWMLFLLSFLIHTLVYIYKGFMCICFHFMTIKSYIMIYECYNSPCFLKFQGFQDELGKMNRIKILLHKSRMRFEKQDKNNWKEMIENII